jgi:hypothetical protein
MVALAAVDVLAQAGRGTLLLFRQVKEAMAELEHLHLWLAVAVAVEHRLSAQMEADQQAATAAQAQPHLFPVAP